MGTRLDVVMPDVEPAHGRAVFQSIADEVARLEGRLSRFRRTSFVTRINLEAGDRPVRLDEEMWSLLTRCAELHRRTSGAFDVTVLPLLQLWGFTGEHPPDKRPSAAEILSVRDRVGMEKLIFDATSAAVRFSVDGMKVDFGAVGKGLALERVEVILRESAPNTARFWSWGRIRSGARGRSAFVALMKIRRFFIRGRRWIQPFRPRAAPTSR